jgi:hypothetical protein
MGGEQKDDDVCDTPEYFRCLRPSAQYSGIAFLSLLDS